MNKKTVEKRTWPFLAYSHAAAFFLALYDVLALNAAYFLALWFRFDCRYSQIPRGYLRAYLRFAPFYTILCVLAFAVLRLYRSIWRFAGVNELIRVTIANAATACFQIIGATWTLWMLSGGESSRMPLSYYFFGMLLQLMLTVGVRFACRFFLLLRDSHKSGCTDADGRIMLVGAGRAGQMILREVQRAREIRGRVCCIIDDDPGKQGHFISGIRVAGGRDTILENVRKYHIDRIIIAIPSAAEEERRAILGICKESGCKIQTLPGIYQLLNGEAKLQNLRDVEIEDLLGRPQVNINNEEVLRLIKGTRVLVTGGGGSIGSELCRQVAANKPEKLIIFDMYENNAYDIQQELKRKYPGLDMEVLIGSVRNTSRICSVMQTYRPDVVFHAAAHKHVPLMEDSPNEAIKNNVMGTYKTAQAAAKAGVKKFVLISTDKAVNPTNIMGASKRICEMIVQMMNRREAGTDFVAVRFGNVLGSNGSVIPLFKKQIAEGGPVTVTDRNIIRYFMTIPEAVSLVLQAAHYAKGGEIFILDMGEPVRIDDMARNLIRLSGLKPDVDIRIEYTGLRPGEKLYEELLMDEEGLQETENKLIYIGHPIRMDDEWFEHMIEKLDKESRSEGDRVRELVAEIVPTYHYKKEDRDEAEAAATAESEVPADGEVPAGSMESQSRRLVFGTGQ